MLDFVRGKPSSVSVQFRAPYSASLSDGANGSADSDAPLFLENIPQTYTHLPAFSDCYFLVDGCHDEAAIAQAAADPCMPGAWQMGIAVLQSRLDEERDGMRPMHSQEYYPSPTHDASYAQPQQQAHGQHDPIRPVSAQPFNRVEGDSFPLVKHPHQHVEQDTQHEMLHVSQPSYPNLDTQLDGHQPFANHFYQTQPEAAKAPFSFSSTAPAPAASTSFSFGASTNAAPASQPDAQSSPFKGFGNNDSSAAPAASPFKFGSSAEPAQKEQSPASPFGFGAPAEKKDETPAKAPTPSFNFGGGAAASPAPAAAPSFSFGASTKSSSPAPASGFSFGNKDDAAPKAPAPAFNFGAAAATPAPVAPASPKPAEKQLPSFAFGASTNTTTPKPADQVSYPNLNGAASSQPESTPFSPAAPASSFNFGANAAPAASSPFKPAAAPNAPESPRPQNAGLGSSMFSSAPTPSKPAESAFKGFGASTSAPPQAQPSAPSTFSGFGSSTTAQSPAPATKSQAPESNALSKSSAASGFATPPASPQLKPSELASSLIKQLNESLRAHLATADTTLDWSNFMRYYLDQVSDIRHQNSAAPSATSAVAPTAPKQPLAPASTCGEKRVADEDAAKEDDSSKRSKMSFSASTTPTKPLSTTASLFDDILNSGSKPQTPQQSNVFSAAADKTPAPPATAPPAKSNPFAAITRNVSATPGPAFKPTGHSVGALQVEPTNIPKPAAPPAFQIPKFGGGAVAATGTPNFLSSFGQKAADEEAKARERRKEEDMDSDEDEEEWERRDAEEQAKKKAELEAAAKAVKFSLDTSKKADSSAKPVFSFGSQSSMTSSQSNIFGNLSNSKPDEDEDDDADTEEDEEVDAAVKQTSPAKPAAGKSLFDRVSFDADKDKSTDAPGTSFKFSSFGSNNSPAADNTWKESTGIRFGDSTGTTTPDGSPAKAAGASVFSSATPAAPAPKFSFGAASQSTPSGDKPSPFSGMFGAKSDDTPKPAASSSVSIFDSAKPSGSTGFQFGGAGASTLAPPSGSSVFASAATSRATTPGAVTTDAEGSAAESEPSDTPNEPQRDLTALTPEDLATSNLAHEARCKATKFVDKAWQAQGLGPIRILTNKETSKPRILMRTDPGGKIALNFNVILNKDLYTVKSAKMVQLTVPADGKKMETYMCTFKDKDKAEEFVAKLHEAIEKAQA